MKKILLGLVLFSLLGCESSEEKQAKLDSQVKQFIEKAVKSDLIDPSSTQFQNLKGFCGEVNSKNRLGGYVGFKRFIVLDSKTVIFEDERTISNKQFPLGWEKICNEKPKFDEKNQLILPNFKLPDPVYDRPVLKTNGETISITPSELVLDENFNYIYPELIFRCSKNNKLDMTLFSFMDVSYNDGYNVMVSQKGNVDDAILLNVNSNEVAQSFEDNTKLFKYLKKHDHVTFAFKAVGGNMSVQSFDLKPVKKALNENKIKCNW